MADGSIIIETLVDLLGLKKGLDSAQGMLNSQSKAFTGLGSIAGKAFNGIGSIATTAMKGVATAITGVTTVMAGVGTYAVKVGSDFEKGMSQVAATMGITVDEIRNGSDSFEMLRQAAKDAGATTQFSATQASEALNYLALAGYDAEKSVTALPTVLNLAAAGGLELGYASDLVTDSMSALGLSTDDLVGFVDELSKTSQKSNTNIAQLGEAILTVGGTAKNLAGGTVELNTALGVLADNGIKASEGGTALRNIILAMTPSTEKAVNAFKDLGVESYDAQGKLRPLNEIFADLNNGLASMTQEEKTRALSAIFNKVDLKSANALLAATVTNIGELGTVLDAAGVPTEVLSYLLTDLETNMYDTSDKAKFLDDVMADYGLTTEQAELAFNGLDSALKDGKNRFMQLSEEIENSTGAADEQARTLNDNLKGAITQLGSATEGLAIEIYENIDTPLKEVVQNGIQYVGQLASALKEGGIPGLVQEIGTVFADVALQIATVAPQVIDTAVNIIQAFITGIRNNLSSITSSAVEIGMTLIQGITSLTVEIISIGSEIIQALLQGISQNAPEIASSAVEIVTTLVEAILTNLPMLLTAAVQLIGEFVIGIAQALPQLVESAGEMIDTILDGLEANLTLLIDAALQLIIALAEGLVKALPTLMQAAPKIIDAILQAIVNNLGGILQAAIEIIAALASGMIANLSNIGTGTFKIVEEIIRIITNTDWLEVGKNILAGLGQGILNGAGMLWDTMKSTIGNLVDRAKSMLGIHSPSTVFAEMGKFLTMGLEKGVTENPPDITTPLKKSADKAGKALESSFSDTSKKVDKSLDDVGKSLEKTGKETDQFSKALKQLSDNEKFVKGATEKLGLSLNETDEYFQEMVKSVQAGQSEMDFTKQAMDKLGVSSKTAEKVYKDLTKTLNSSTESTKKSKKSWKELSDEEAKATTSTDKLTKSTKEQSKASDEMTETTKRLVKTRETLVKATQEMGLSTEEASNYFQRLMKDFKDGKSESEITAKLMKELGLSAEQAKEAFDSLSQGLKEGSNDTDNYNLALQRLSTNQDVLRAAVEEMGMSLTEADAVFQGLAKSIQEGATESEFTSKAITELGLSSEQAATLYKELNGVLSAGSVIMSDAAVVFGGLIQNLTEAGQPTVDLTDLLSALSSGIYDTSNKTTFMNQVMADFNLTQAQASLAFDELSAAMNNNGIVIDSYTEAMNILSSNQDIVTGAVKKMGLSLSETDGYFQKLIYSLRDGATEFDFTKQLMDELGLSSDQAKQVYDQLNAVVDKGTISATDNMKAYNGLKDEIDKTSESATKAGETSTGLGGKLDTTAKSASSASDKYSGLNSTISASTSSTSDAANAFEGLSSTISDTTSNMVQNSQSAVTSIGDAFSQLPSKVIPAFYELQTNITKWFSDLNNEGKKGIDLFNKTIVDTITALAKKFKEQLNQIKQNISTWFAELINLASSKIKQFSDIITNALTNMSSKVRQILDSLKQSIQTWFTQLVNMAREQMQQFSDTVTKALETMSTNSQNIVRQLKEAVSTLFQDMVNMVTEQMQNMVNVITEQMQALTDAIVDGFTRASDEATQLVDEMTSSLINAFDDMATQVSQLVDEMTNSLIRAFGDMVSQVSNAMDDLAWVIESSLSNMSGGFYDVGVEIVRGIGNGIISQSAWLENIIDDLIQDAVDAAKDAAEVHSPSRRMARELGKPMAQGIGVGFEKEAARIFSKMKSVVDAETAHFTAKVSARTNIPSSNQYTNISKTTTNNPVLNFYQPIQSPSQISRQIKRTMKELTYG